MTVGTVENERDFYFSKLRDIEMLFQNNVEHSTTAAAEDAMKILFATETQVVTVDDDGVLTIEGG